VAEEEVVVASRKLTTHAPLSDMERVLFREAAKSALRQGLLVRRWRMT